MQQFVFPHIRKRKPSDDFHEFFFSVQLTIYPVLSTSLTCRKWANTMFMYMSSSSLPLPMKHRCSPLAMEPDSNDCF